MQTIVRPSRALGLLVALLTADAGVAALLRPPAQDLLGGLSRAQSCTRWPLDRLVGDIAAVLCAAAITGGTMLVLLSLVAQLTIGRAPGIARRCDRLTPRRCRLLVAAAIGVGLTTPVIVEGGAEADWSAHPPVCQTPCHDVVIHLGGLPMPDLPIGTWPRTAARSPSSAGPRTVVVRHGDSLWRIAECSLPSDASAAVIATAVQRLYEANRARIGGDPDLILPGTILHTPEGTP